MNLLHELLNNPEPGPFALLRREGREQLELLRGPLTVVSRLADIPLPDGAGDHTLAVVPFQQLAERGFDCVADGTPLICLTVTESAQITLADALAALPTRLPPIDDQGFDITDEAYEEIVDRVLTEEIGRGEGSNFVIHRTRLARSDSPPLAVAGAAMRRLLAAEQGVYWTFLVHLPGSPATGPGRTLVGATPERHVSVEDGLVTMNPISGTLRHADVTHTDPDQPQSTDHERLLRFLTDPKEVNELSMVLDEELKMMAVVAEQGGQVLGPYLKQMSQLTHTEYLLAGRTTLDVRTVLRETMFAPTLTGSPIENAARVIARHERTGRAYYGGVLALLGNDERGGQRLDAPILFRCADISHADGSIAVKVGATLVRDSTPQYEVAETHAKAAGVLTALGLRRPTQHRVTGRVEPAIAQEPATARFADDPRVAAALAARNDRLASFWLTERAPVGVGSGLLGRSVLVVDAEDTFTGMLAHMLRSLGMRVTVQPTHAHDSLTPYDLVVAGPGPGDPGDLTDTRIAALRAVVDERLAQRAPLLAICLGHQLLSLRLGLAMHRRAEPLQGVPMDIDLFGTVRRVGYYSTFTALGTADTVPSPYGPVELSRAPGGEVHALRGPNLAGLQFHPESVLTEHGPQLLAELIAHLLPAATPVPVLPAAG